MTRTELAAWQRRFEWDLTHEEARVATAHMRKHGHDLLGQIQIVDLVSQELGRHALPVASNELVEDLQRAAIHLRAAAHGLLG
ncbi:MAG: hypothetical protein H0T79_23695, partial [Deltaproteobacteria bacterium]|nr:hypothetical protein [Deltaproteobacteria bacterium]